MSERVRMMIGAVPGQKKSRPPIDFVNMGMMESKTEQ